VLFIASLPDAGPCLLGEGVRAIESAGPAYAENLADCYGSHRVVQPESRSGVACCRQLNASRACVLRGRCPGGRPVDVQVDFNAFVGVRVCDHG